MQKHDYRMWWAGADKGWMLDVTIALTPAAVASIRDYTLRVQRQRLLGLGFGAVRDECLETIRALECNMITQNIAGSGERVLFDAYKSDKIISLGVQ